MRSSTLRWSLDSRALLLANAAFVMQIFKTFRNLSYVFGMKVNPWFAVVSGRQSWIMENRKVWRGLAKGCRAPKPLGVTFSQLIRQWIIAANAGVHLLYFYCSDIPSSYLQLAVSIYTVQRPIFWVISQKRALTTTDLRESLIASFGRIMSSYPPVTPPNGDFPPNGRLFHVFVNLG